MRLRKGCRLGTARPGFRALVSALVALFVLTACTGGGEPERTSPSLPATPVTLTYAHEQEFLSYNNNVAALASPANAVILSQVLRGFWSAGPGGEIVPDTDFGTFERVTSNPLTVRYTFASGATWSDGRAIDCDDAVLAWAVNSGRWPTGKKDPQTGQRIGAFASARPGAWANVNPPQCEDGDRTFTVVYDTVYSDWATLFGAGSILPAHVVEKESGVEDLISAVREGETKTMSQIGDIYNSLWAFKPGEYRTEISPSSGPYQIADWHAGQSVTLRPNDRWWGRPPRATTVVVRFIPQGKQVEALRSGAVQVIDPPPTTELLAQLAEPGRTVRVSVADSFTWEHLDFNVEGKFKDKELRRAFAKCVPRQQIVDNLVKPQNPAAQVLQSRFKLPFQRDYPAFADLGGQDYDEVDIAGAKKILEELDKAGTKVRIGYASPNPRRKAEVDLIRDFCGQAGFKVVDGGTPDFLTGALEDGDFDVALFAWTGSPMLTQGYAVYLTDGTQNKGGYSNPQVDQLLKQLYSELNPGTQRTLLQQLDRTLWSDLATMPLFAFPALVATAPEVQGVRYNPSAAGVTYNVNDWSRTR